MGQIAFYCKPNERIRVTRYEEQNEGKLAQSGPPQPDKTTVYFRLAPSVKGLYFSNELILLLFLYHINVF